MSGPGSGDKGDGLLRSSSPAGRTAKPKSSSSSLSSQLSAHLSKPVAPRPAVASSPALVGSSAAPPAIDRRVHVGIQQSGKAIASAADAEELGDSELWKSNAAKRAEKAWALQSERSLQSDAKFKKYTSSVEKSLATFESVSEWADFIAFLSRLLKTLQLSPSFNVIPRKLIVSKRLSQCLNPALPSGVHQRALDVYEHILVIIGREGLRRDLLVWTPGLLPFFQYASTSVKPIVLSMFERHFLALGQDLRPVSRALILSILPGLEEETNESFDRVIRLLDRTRDSVGQPFFLQNIFLILITTAGARLPALNYLAKRLPKLNGDDDDASHPGGSDVRSIVGEDLGLLVRGFAAALEDDTFLLVRRASLDILVTHLRLDSKTWQDLVQEEDKIRLIKAAIAVVLRRDLSLNRRLYAWILGPSEDIPVQQRYFEEHAQRLSRLALLAELIQGPLVDVSSKDQERESAARQRPFKIFVSLLDKWSIGQPLTDALVLDTFQALQFQLAGIEGNKAAKDASLKSTATEITTAAKMLFEVVDPFTTYRQFFLRIKEEITGSSQLTFSAISLLQFVLKSFRVHDEESRQIHLPILLSVILELMEKCENSEIKIKAFQLSSALLHLLPKRIFARSSGQAGIEVSFVEHATSFYQSDSYNADEAAQRYIGFQHPSTQANLLRLMANAVRDEQVRTAALDSFSLLLQIFDASSISSADEQVKIGWTANEWLKSSLPMMQSAKSFAQVEAFINAFIGIAKCKCLAKSVSLGRHEVAVVVYDKMFLFLHPSTSPYHVRCVELLWSVADLTRGRYLETLLCKGLVSDSVEIRQTTRDVFGAIWLFSPEERLASLSVTEPVLLILEGLRSSVWTERQASEKWLKANLRGYALYLDPLLQLLAGADIQREPAQIKFDGLSFGFHRYIRPFDHEKVLYALNTILLLARFGAQTMMKTLRSTPVKRSHYSSIVQAFHEEGSSGTTYLHALLASLSLFLRSDFAAGSPYVEVYTNLHTASAELLQALLLRGPLQGSWLSDVEDTLLQRLYVSVRRGNLDVQNCLLQTLSSVVRSKTAEGTHRESAPKPLLLVVIKEALTTPGNRPVLAYWTDFVYNIVPHYRKALTMLLLPLNEAVCRSVVEAMVELKGNFCSTTSEGQSQLTDAEIILLLNINERLLLQCLDEADGYSDKETPAAAVATNAPEKTDLASLLGFPSESSSVATNVPSQNGSTGNSVLLTLHNTVRALHFVWAATSETVTDTAVGEARQRSLEVVNPKIKARCRRSLERIYRNNSGEVVESLIDCWSSAGGVRMVHLPGSIEDTRGQQVTFEILSTLAPSAQIVVTFLCDVISSRTTPSGSSASEKGASKKAFTPIVSESVLLSFWEAYLDRLDGAATMQIWPVVIMLIRDITHNSAAHKAQMYPVLRCFTVTGEKLLGTNGNGSEDKKIKRDFVDAYMKLCDYNVLIAGRSFEQTNWISRRTLAISEEDAEEEGRATPISDDKMGASLPDLATGGLSVIESINEYLASRVLPALRKYGVEQDRIITLCTNIVYYIITPALRVKKKTLDVSPGILKLLTEVTRMSGTVRAWKNAVADVFQDARFFQMPVDAGVQWMPVVLSLLNSDKERFVELIGKVTSTPSTNIFTNKEAETIVRSTNLRRITFAIFAGERDHWLTHLPPLQEKLVDLLRNGSSDTVGSDVYLCLRVLLVRFSPRHLSAFWPVIITELVRLFEGCIEDEMPAEESDTLQLLFAACQFLDLLFTLQTDDFQLHQWLFITDTVDVVRPPEDWISDSILDRMAAILMERRGASKSLARGTEPVNVEERKGSEAVNGLHKDQETALAVISRKRSPRLVKSSSIATVDDLLPFFASVSRQVFEQTYQCGENVNWEAVEDSLAGDIFPNE